MAFLLGLVRMKRLQNCLKCPFGISLAGTEPLEQFYFSFVPTPPIRGMFQRKVKALLHSVFSAEKIAEIKAALWKAFWKLTVQRESGSSKLLSGKLIIFHTAHKCYVFTVFLLLMSAVYHLLGTAAHKFIPHDSDLTLFILKPIAHFRNIQISQILCVSIVFEQLWWK